MKRPFLAEPGMEKVGKTFVILSNSEKRSFRDERKVVLAEERQSAPFQKRFEEHNKLMSEKIIKSKLASQNFAAKTPHSKKEE